MADFKILGFHNPKLKILADFKILAFQNSEIQISADFNICDPPQEFDAKGEGTLTTRFHDTLSVP